MCQAYLFINKSTCTRASQKVSYMSYKLQYNLKTVELLIIFFEYNNIFLNLLLFGLNIKIKTTRHFFLTKHLKMVWENSKVLHTVQAVPEISGCPVAGDN